MIVHHQPLNPSSTWRIHAWDVSSSLDLRGTQGPISFDYDLPVTADARQTRFKFHRTEPATHAEIWESDDFTRWVRRAAPAEVWSFGDSPRVLYRDPNPAGVVFSAGDGLTFNVVTRQRFSGGRLYAWNPFDPSGPSAFFAETERHDPVSSFAVVLSDWMVSGFHFKLVGSHGGAADWEPDSSNRVWRPVDGSAVWFKSGQVSLRPQPLEQTVYPIEALYSSRMPSPPLLCLNDPVEKYTTDVPVAGDAVYPADSRFRVATYDASIFPDAAYQVYARAGEGSAPFTRAFPSPWGDQASPSRFVLGADGWAQVFPNATTPTTLTIEPRPPTGLGGSVSVELGIGNQVAGGEVPYDVVQTIVQADGTLRAPLEVVPGNPHWLRLRLAASEERKPYPWIDSRRLFTPTGPAASFWTAEGVYGLSDTGPVEFADIPAPLRRADLMQAAFGPQVASQVAFGPGELPHGTTRVGNDVFFVLHAPHAGSAGLVLIQEGSASQPSMRLTPVPMMLTPDALYWWCRMPAAATPPGTRYRFMLSQNQEVLDPAAREVLDGGSFATGRTDDPNDPSTSWSVIVDEEAIRASATAPGWNTMGWEALLVYELHPRRFTDVQPGNLAPFDLIADELAPVCRRGGPGYLWRLPVTALELMPVHEFKSTRSWGYNPAFFFAVDSSYGGAAGLARLVRAAHASGRGVLLDVVYNHMNDSPLTQLGYDVYRNGEAWGDRINSGHPMVREFFRQATIYVWRTFGLDGFRLDATQTILKNPDGWEFLRDVRLGVRAAASAEGKRAPYFVGENDEDERPWNMTNPGWRVMDGQWQIDEVYQLGHAAYDSWQPSQDHAADVAQCLQVPVTWPVWSFFAATRFGESHDSVSAQDSGNQRIARRPPFGQGLQMAKAIGALVLLSKGIPLLFMGQEVGETRPFSFQDDAPAVNPQLHDFPAGAATDNARVLEWFRALMGLRNDPAKGLRGDASQQVVGTGRRTVAFTCGFDQRLFVVVTFGTETQVQNSAWLGLPGQAAYKEIFNSSWPAYQTASEPEHTNGGYDAAIAGGALLQLPHIGAIVLERR